MNLVIASPPKLFMSQTSLLSQIVSLVAFLCMSDFGGDSTFRGPERGVVSFPYINLVIASPPRLFVSETLLLSQIVGLVAWLCTSDFVEILLSGAQKGAGSDFHI